MNGLLVAYALRTGRLEAVLQGRAAGFRCSLLNLRTWFCVLERPSVQDLHALFPALRYRHSLHQPVL